MKVYNIQRYVLFEKFPRLYDLIINVFGYKRAVRRFMRRFKSNGVIVDLGCGSGLLSVCVAKNNRNSSVIAIDKSDGLLKILRDQLDKEGVKNVEIIRSDLSQCLPIKNNTLDFVITSGLIEYVDYDDLFKGVYRSLKMNGRFLILAIKNNVFGRLLGKIFGFRPCNLRDILDMLYKTGFRRVKLLDFDDLKGLNMIKTCIVSIKSSFSFQGRDIDGLISFLCFL